MKVFKYQHWHLLLLLILLGGLYYVVTTDASLLKGELWGIPTSYWFVITLLVPILHQVYVLICWRLELHYQSITKVFGKNGFKRYKIGFAVLILSRPVTIILLAIANANTLTINTVLAYVLSGILLIPALYLAYSLQTYFGIDRAFGIDHFYPEKYINAPLVKKGIFKYSSNAMYVYGFLILYVPGLLLQSKAALFLALFQHLYIWVHYYCTERPDMNVIYKEIQQ